MAEPTSESTIRKVACKAPVPLGGLMLGLASAGNMVPDVKLLFGVLSLSVLAIILLRIVLDTKNFKEEMKNPAIAGISCTIPMGIMVLTTYTEPSLPTFSYAIFIGALLTHFALMIYFTKTFMLKFDVHKMLPAYFVVYVGIAVGSVVAPIYDAYTLGQALFWFGFASYLVLLPLIFYRVSIKKTVPEPLLPTVAIFAAPASLCLAGYLSSFQSKEMALVGVLFSLSLISYIAVILYLPKLLKLKFYPSCSAFTFPLVISAIATNATYKYLKAEGTDIPALQYLAWFEIALALVLITYVLVRYTDHFVLKRAKKAGPVR